jgi:hypothetical protein
MPGITAIPDVPDAPTIGTVTDAGTGSSATVAYTAAVTGGTVTTFTATSTPGSFTGTGSSPITVSGLTAGTSYTFKVKGTNATATGPESSASSAITLTTPTSYQSIATFAVGAGGSASINFTSIPQTYKHLQVRYIARNTSTGYVNGGATYMQFNGDTTVNYSFHDIRGDGTSATAYSQPASGGNNVMYVNGTAGSGSSNTLIYGVAIVDILDYTNTNKNKTIRVIGGQDTNGAGMIDLDSGAWYSTSAVTSIQIINGPFAQNSHFALYGIKG